MRNKPQSSIWNVKHHHEYHYVASISRMGVVQSVTPTYPKEKTWTMAEGGASASAKLDSGLLKYQVVSPVTGKVIKLPQHEILGTCRSVSDFEKLNRIGEGTYGIVYRAKDLKSGEIVALKKIRMEREKEGTTSSTKSKLPQYQI